MPHIARHGRGQRAFTLVELLVVLAILAMLVALLLSAVQRARETARLAQCANHLRQLALAALLLEQATGALPAGGWGASWSGEPERGAGRRQPGGWVYQVLPYLEQAPLYERGRGISGPARHAAFADVASTPLPLFHCPSRRVAARYPHRSTLKLFNVAPRPADVARSDFAMNVGDQGTNALGPDNNNQAGPPSLAAGEDGAYRWPNTARYRGVCHPAGAVELRQIASLGDTYLFGEKYVPFVSYEDGNDPGEPGHMYQGFSPDTARLASAQAFLLRDGRSPYKEGFGSPHAEACQFAFCDGAVRRIAYDIDHALHAQLGNREKQSP